MWTLEYPHDSSFPQSKGSNGAKGTQALKSQPMFSATPRGRRAGPIQCAETTQEATLVGDISEASYDKEQNEDGCFSIVRI